MANVITRRGALLLGGAALSLPFIRTARAQQAYEFVAGSVGGGWYTIAAGFSSLVAEEFPDIRLRVVPGGGLANSTRVNNNQSQVGFGIDAFAAAARRGEEPYSVKHETMSSLGVGYSPTEHNLIRRADAGPEGMREILTQRGLKIACPQRSSTDEMTLQRILKFYGTTPDAIRASGGRYLNGSYADIAAAYNDGQVDYLYAALAKPAAILTEIGQGRRPSRVVAWPEDVRKHLAEVYAYNQGVLPANTYPSLGQTTDLTVTTMDTVIMVHNSLPEPVAYGITKTLIKHAGPRLTQIHASCAAFDPREAWKYNGLPLHPGAARAFREAGVMPAA